MKHFVFALLFVLSCHSLTAAADDNVRAAQTRLRQEGFYFGNPDGKYDKETSAAVTRYQIRHGLQITGQLDAATAQALGTRPLAAGAGGTPLSLSGTWRQLRNGEQQFVPESRSPTAGSRTAAGKPTSDVQQSTSPPPATTAVPVARTSSEENAFDRERLRDYIGAFVLAGLDPKVGAELEFFAERVDYFGDGKRSRAQIRSDLLRYDARWPERRFWLAGELDVHPQTGNRVRVTFPLRYELRSRADHASGTVRKTLVLQKTARNDFEIVAVNETRGT